MRSLDLNATFSNETIRRERIFLSFFFFLRKKLHSIGSSRSSRDTANDSTRQTVMTLAADVKISLLYRGPSPASIYQWSLDSKPLEAIVDRPSPRRLLLANFVFEYDGQPECQPRLRGSINEQGRAKYISRSRSLAIDIRPDRSIQNYRAREKIWEKLEEKWTDRSKL